MFSNIVIIGFLDGILGLTFSNVEKLISKKFAKKGDDIQTPNKYKWWYK